MAFLGIAREPCPHCKSKNTVENSRRTGGPNIEREVILTCWDCQRESLYGIYQRVHGSFVKIR